MIKRPALRYFGSKWRSAAWIISYFPAHVCYVEPFCGGASVLLNKQPSEFEVMNDLDRRVGNFFTVLREHTDELIRQIELTPYSRDEYKLAWQEIDDPIEQARRFYISAWQGWGGNKGLRPESSAWRFQHSNNRGKSVVADWNQVDHLYAIAWRLKRVFIENDDAIKVIERYDQPHTLFYVDPPYLLEARCNRWGNLAYSCGIGVDYHRQLLDVLRGVKGMVILSGYPSELYDDALRGWDRVETQARTTNAAKLSTEVLWLSPRLQAARLPMFAIMQGETAWPI